MPHNYYEDFSKNIDEKYSYSFAKKIESFKSNPLLGYRTAGSDAEHETACFIEEEMKKIGLSDVTKDAVTVDGWEFTKAIMRYTDTHGISHRFILGSYQTEFDTEGEKEFEVIFVGKGTESEYDGIDVTDKLVIADIDQRNEWWISYPVYQAYLKGAAALIAVQTGGYGEIDGAALNAQDIAGPDYAPAFSMSKNDAEILKKDIISNGSVKVIFDAKSEVWRGAVSYNVWGEIKGEDTDSALMISAHYDSYFTGFQDDNSAVAMMLSIARSLISIGYKPRKTMRFCAFAAEEWGIINSKYDWSSGAYAQLYKKRKDWRGKTYVGMNLELPACRHGDTDAIHCSYEYKNFFERTLPKIPLDKSVFSGYVKVISPVETWSDDFTLSVSGIPSSVNDFSDTEFMTTTYHSQFDNDSKYAPDVYRFHHILYGGMAIAFDRCSVAPLDFSVRFRELKNSLGTYVNTARLRALFERAGNISSYLTKKITRVNTYKRQRRKWKSTESMLLSVFGKCEDSFVRLNWQDDVRFPHEILENDIEYMEAAVLAFKDGKGKTALKNMYSIDNNRYAFEFEEAVFTYFTQYVLQQPVSRLQWGAGRVICHESLFDIIQKTKAKLERADTDYGELIYLAEIICKRMLDNLKVIISEEEKATEGIISDLEKIVITFPGQKPRKTVKKGKSQRGKPGKKYKRGKKK